MTTEFQSEFLKLSNGARARFANIGSFNRNLGKVFVNDLNGEILISCNCADEAEAELEIDSVGEQIDAWEASRMALPDRAAAKSGRK